MSMSLERAFCKRKGKEGINRDGVRKKKEDGNEERIKIGERKREGEEKGGYENL